MRATGTCDSKYCQVNTAGNASSSSSLHATIPSIIVSISSLVLADNARQRLCLHNNQNHLTNNVSARKPRKPAIIMSRCHGDSDNSIRHCSTASSRSAAP
jgi:hypothetical protein